MGTSVAFTVHYEPSKILITVKFKFSYYCSSKFVCVCIHVYAYICVYIYTHTYIVLLQKHFGNLAALERVPFPP